MPGQDGKKTQIARRRCSGRPPRRLKQSNEKRRSPKRNNSSLPPPNQRSKSSDVLSVPPPWDAKKRFPSLVRWHIGTVWVFQRLPPVIASCRGAFLSIFRGCSFHERYHLETYRRAFS